jgi:hypothetical protein
MEQALVCGLQEYRRWQAGRLSDLFFAEIPTFGKNRLDYRQILVTVIYIKSVK